MPLDHLLAFAAATVVLILIPGPNVALIVANSIAHGVRYGLLTVLGTSAAMLVQLALTVLGLSTALGTLGSWFGWLRWIGVAYLLYLGLTTWFAPAVDLGAAIAQARRFRTIVGRGFLVSLTNPKTLLFYGAFFPQFIAPGAPAGAEAQSLILAGSFFSIAVVLDSGWAILAGRLRAALAGRCRLHNRLTGGALMGAGLGLALARAP